MRLVAAVVALLAAALPAGADLDPTRSRSYVPDEDIRKVKVEIDSTYDKFSDAGLVGAKEPKTLAGGAMFGTDIHFNVVRAYSSAGDPFFYVRINSRSKKWIFLNGNLRFLIDGVEQADVKGPGSDKERDYSCNNGLCFYYEGERIPIPAGLLARLARANSIELRIMGKEATYERWFKKDQHALVRAMASRYGVTNAQWADSAAIWRHSPISPK